MAAKGTWRQREEAIRARKLFNGEGSHQLDAGELAQVCKSLGLIEEGVRLEAAADLAAGAIAHKLGIEVTSKAETPQFDRCHVGFGPAVLGQAIPKEIEHFDPRSDWAMLSRGER